ncbi:phosphatase RsbU N-terminal domain-containing protein [Pedococcus sp. 5OH_020]|uniref:phosphatase RsbU N-terminal domain-containing protein n=1 Tax=Pedococcus sp. 5OH_020 TaxID=2989814 RepID=UPI0022E9FA5C|nr:phosphatase RsbU N-terminal domain-containing protein [Pedococcus sp. 5OH_020]
MNLGDLELDYRAAFLRYLPRREEVARARGYDIGRQAVATGVSILDVAAIHHEILLEVLHDTPAAEVDEITGAAAEFLQEVLAPYDMTQRGLLEGS